MRFGLALLGFLAGLSVPEAFPRTYDEAKAERLALQRDMRRERERRYEACLTTCREKCK